MARLDIEIWGMRFGFGDSKSKLCCLDKFFYEYLGFGQIHSKNLYQQLREFQITITRVGSYFKSSSVHVDQK